MAAVAGGPAHDADVRIGEAEFTGSASLDRVAVIRLGATLSGSSLFLSKDASTDFETIAKLVETIPDGKAMRMQFFPDKHNTSLTILRPPNKPVKASGITGLRIRPQDGRIEILGIWNHSEERIWPLRKKTKAESKGGKQRPAQSGEPKVSLVKKLGITATPVLEKALETVKRSWAQGASMAKEGWKFDLTSRPLDKTDFPNTEAIVAFASESRGKTRKAILAFIQSKGGPFSQSGRAIKKFHGELAAALKK